MPHYGAPSTIRYPAHKWNTIQNHLIQCHKRITKLAHALARPHYTWTMNRKFTWIPFIQISRAILIENTHFFLYLHLHLTVNWNGHILTQTHAFVEVRKRNLNGVCVSRKCLVWILNCKHSWIDEDGEDAKWNYLHYLLGPCTQI